VHAQDGGLRQRKDFNQFAGFLGQFFPFSFFFNELALYECSSNEFGCLGFN